MDFELWIGGRRELASLLGLGDAVKSYESWVVGSGEMGERWVMSEEGVMVESCGYISFIAIGYALPIPICPPENIVVNFITLFFR